MAKVKLPALSLRAKGILGKDLSFDNRMRQHRVRRKPIPRDAKSFAQLSWRHMYQKAIALWRLLSAAEKQEWESLARPKHMTGYAYFISLALKPNPGLYLPLQGGAMQGDIAMTGHEINTLPAPLLPFDAARKVYVDDEIDADIITHSAILAAHTQNQWQLSRTGRYLPLPNVIGAPSGLPVTKDRVYAIPLVVARTETTDRISIQVTAPGAGGKKAYLAIYNNGNNCHPGTLLLDASTVDIDAAAVVAAIINQQLTKGLYWLALLAEDNCSIYGQYTNWSPIGMRTTDHARVSSCWWRASAYGGGLPDPYPPGVAEQDNSYLILLRLASLD